MDQLAIEGDPSPDFLNLILSVLKELPADARARLAKAGFVISQDLIRTDRSDNRRVIAGTCRIRGMAWVDGPIVLYEPAIGLRRDVLKRTILHELAHSLGASEKTVQQLGY